MAFYIPYLKLLELLNRETEDFGQKMTLDDKVKCMFLKFRVKVKPEFSWFSTNHTD
jgi:hypothetical protein